MQAAQGVFARKGFHASRVADVAAGAQGTVRHYFDSKETLLMAVFEAWKTEYLRQIMEDARLENAHDRHAPRACDKDRSRSLTILQQTECAPWQPNPSYRGPIRRRR
jgi:AcrR family transcriptional regulator